MGQCWGQWEEGQGDQPKAVAFPKNTANQTKQKANKIVNYSKLKQGGNYHNQGGRHLSQG